MCYPTRIHNNSTSIINNIFIDKFKNENYTICLLVNGLSDYDAQISTLLNINIQNPSYARTI